jgi:hypothetical protein
MHTSIFINFPCRWTGSNTNQNNNDGQGTPGSDRNNFVVLNQRVFLLKETQDSFFYNLFIIFKEFQFEILQFIRSFRCNWKFGC